MKKIIIGLIIGYFFVWFFFIQENKKNFGINSLSLKDIEHFKIYYPQEKLQELHYLGYSAGYSKQRRTSLWVSYPLKKEFIYSKKKLVKRKFTADPNLPEKEAVSPEDYRNSGYDRGHLARQADMKGRSQKCELEAYYMTNIAPQKPNFNRKIWLNLEDAVQDFAKKYGEILVISGPFYDDNHSYISNNIEIPDGFYKIIVRIEKQNLLFNSFVLWQDDNSYNIEKYLVSVDSIETLTGIDFFRELPDSLENLLESYPFALWKTN